MIVSDVFSHITCTSVPSAEVNTLVGIASTTIVPPKLTLAHAPPVVETVYQYGPETVGVPLIVNTPAA